MPLPVFCYWKNRMKSAALFTSHYLCCRSFHSQSVIQFMPLPVLLFEENTLKWAALFTSVCLWSRLIQEEKESTEQRAEELESRVGSGSLDPSRWGTADRSFDRSSPPLSGRSTPTPTRPSYQTRDNYSSSLNKYHTVSSALGCVAGVVPVHAFSGQSKSCSCTIHSA